MITPKAINRKKRSSISLIKGFIVFLLITIYQRVKLKADSREKVDWPPESPDNQYHLNK